MDFGLDLFEGTWLYEAPGAIADVLGGLVPILIVGGIVAAIAGFAFMYVARGAGQYGIIEGYVGTIGAGKTTLAVQHALGLARARGAVLLSNIPVVCGPTCTRALCDNGEHALGLYVVGRKRPRCVAAHACVIEHGILPMNDAGLDLGELTRRAFQLRDEQRGLVLLMDEVGVIMPARLWKEFSVALMWVLQQSRKLACEWIWTAQDPSFVDHQLRSLTAVVHYVRAYPPPSIWRRARGKRPWLMVASAFTPTQAPRANGEGLRSERRIGRRMVRYQRRFELAFDTDGVVLPSRHLKGAETLVAAVESTRDRHVIESGTSTWGPLVTVEEDEEVA